MTGEVYYIELTRLLWNSSYLCTTGLINTFPPPERCLIKSWNHQPMPISHSQQLVVMKTTTFTSIEPCVLFLSHILSIAENIYTHSRAMHMCMYMHVQVIPKPYCCPHMLPMCTLCSSLPIEQDVEKSPHGNITCQNEVPQTTTQKLS